jgi:3-hydroxyisobutyrate dehydrogenase-like beta-hydroxyacid dehydrogenase
MAARIGVLGLGKMGGAFAARLRDQGYETYGYDPSDAATERFVAEGGIAASLKSVADCHTVISSLPSDSEVIAVFDDQLLADLSGGTLIELSTILPSTMVALAGKAATHDVQVVDCPVSGGFNDARAGTIVLLVGADKAVLERNTELLNAMGVVRYVGKVGNGKIVKLVNNMMSLGNMVVAAEAFALGASLGMDGQELFDVLNQSGGRSLSFTRRIPSVLQRDFSARFALYLAEKDLRLALEMGHQGSYPMPVTAAVHQVYEMATTMGLSSEDQAAVIKVYQAWAQRGNGDD